MTASINRKSDFVTFICYRKCSEKSGNLFTEQYLFSEILFHVDMPQKIIYICIYIFFERVKYSSKGRKKCIENIEHCDKMWMGNWNELNMLCEFMWIVPGRKHYNFNIFDIFIRFTKVARNLPNIFTMQMLYCVACVIDKTALEFAGLVKTAFNALE